MPHEAWEYQVVEIGLHGADSRHWREKTLMDFGAEGWELTSVVSTGHQHALYLKRPIENNGADGP